MGLKILAWKWK